MLQNSPTFLRQLVHQKRGAKMSIRKLKTATHVNQILMEKLIFPGMVVVDATLGNGFDAKKLLELIGPKGLLYGFDIQRDAIDSTLLRLEGLPSDTYKLFQRSHSDLLNTLRVQEGVEEVDFVVFNLGYLPKGDKAITTALKTTLLGIEQAFQLLSEGGLLMVTVYPGHLEGAVEADYLHKWFSGQSQKIVDVLHYSFLNHANNPPSTYILEKRSEMPLEPINTIKEKEA